MTSNNDSFISAMTRPRKVQSKALDELTKLGGTRSTHIPVPPVNAPGEAPDSILEQAVEEPGSIAATVDTAPPIEPTTPIAPPVVPDAASLELSDEQFRKRVGRPPGTGDRMLMDARKRFVALKGRAPRPDELLFEAKRAIVGQTDLPGVIP